MAVSNKTSKEMFVVSYKEIPENICVETKFISKAAALQNKYDNLYYMNINQGLTDMSAHDAFVAHSQLQNMRTIRQLAHGVKSNSQASVMKSVAFTPAVSNTSGQQSSSFIAPSTGGQGLTYKALPMPINLPPYSATHLTNFATPKGSTHLPLSTVSAHFSSPILPSASYGTSSLFKPPVVTKDSECMTEPKPVCVDQEQQTSCTPSVASIAIQCCIDEDFYDVQIVEEKTDSLIIPAKQLIEEEEKEEFLKYVRENSVDYENHLRECLICGEVCKSSKYFYGHMAVHRGPKCLCFLCGHHLENESLLKTHYCAGTKRKDRALLRCPHTRCKVVAVSRLELYDHLNEHNGNRLHKCSACRKSFCTVQEFRRHLLLRAKCFTDAKLYRNRLYGLRNRADRRCRVRVFTLHSHTRRTAMAKSPLSGRRTKKYLCEICYIPYRSKYIYHHHVKKCAALLRKRINRTKRTKNTRKNFH